MKFRSTQVLVGAILATVSFTGNAAEVDAFGRVYSKASYESRSKAGSFSIYDAQIGAKGKIDKEWSATAAVQGKAASGGVNSIALYDTYVMKSQAFMDTDGYRMGIIGNDYSNWYDNATGMDWLFTSIATTTGFLADGQLGFGYNAKFADNKFNLGVQYNNGDMTRGRTFRSKGAVELTLGGAFDSFGFNLNTNHSFSTGTKYGQYNVNFYYKGNGLMFLAELMQHKHKNSTNYLGFGGTLTYNFYKTLGLYGRYFTGTTNFRNDVTKGFAALGLTAAPVTGITGGLIWETMGQSLTKVRSNTFSAILAANF